MTLWSLNRFRRWRAWCLAAVGVLALAMASFTRPAWAYTAQINPLGICNAASSADEAAVGVMKLAPSSGSTVTVGTPITFSAETNTPATFEVASSEALLSSPDIENVMGSPSGAFYVLDSTSATASARTIYWRVSSTTTPEDCERPVTFTSPVHTLIIVPSEAELLAPEKAQEEAAAKKRAEEEATAEKKWAEEAGRGTVTLDGLVLGIPKRREAAAKLTCSDVERCKGQITLTARVRNGKGRVRHAGTEKIGTGNFAIAAGKEMTVEIPLIKSIDMLLSAAHGHLGATLTIRRTSPAPIETKTKSVRLHSSS